MNIEKILKTFFIIIALILIGVVLFLYIIP